MEGVSSEGEKEEEREDGLRMLIPHAPFGLSCCASTHQQLLCSRVAFCLLYAAVRIPRSSYASLKILEC
jgi:hypothetical protein